MGRLYVSVSTLYSQLDPLENMQGESTEKKVELQEWEIYLQKTDNTNVSTLTYLENLKIAIGSVSDIFSNSFWLKMAL